MADQHEQQTGQPVFRMQKMYIKDLSFESPHAPQVFQASQKHEPTIELDLKLKHEVVAEDNYEVSMTVTAKMVDKTSCLALSRNTLSRVHQVSSNLCSMTLACALISEKCFLI